MLHATRQLHYTGNNIHQPPMKSITKRLEKLLNAVRQVWKPTPNQFDNRYAEKFPNPDHCQWQGGRLLTQQELRELTETNDPDAGH